MCGVTAWEIWGPKNTGTRDAHRFLRIRTWGSSPVCPIFALNWEQLRLIFPDTNLHTILKTLGGGCKHEKINGFVEAGFVGADVVDFLGHRVACEFRARFGSDTTRARSAEFRRLPESG